MTVVPGNRCIGGPWILDLTPTSRAGRTCTPPRALDGIFSTRQHTTRQTTVKISAAPATQYGGPAVLCVCVCSCRLSVTFADGKRWTNAHSLTRTGRLHADNLDT